MFNTYNKENIAPTTGPLPPARNKTNDPWSQSLRVDNYRFTPRKMVKTRMVSTQSRAKSTNASALSSSSANFNNSKPAGTNIARRALAETTNQVSSVAPRQSKTSHQTLLHQPSIQHQSYLHQQNQQQSGNSRNEKWELKKQELEKNRELFLAQSRQRANAHKGGPDPIVLAPTPISSLSSFESPTVVAQELPLELPPELSSKPSQQLEQPNSKPQHAFQLQPPQAVPEQSSSHLLNSQPSQHLQSNSVSFTTPIQEDPEV